MNAKRSLILATGLIFILACAVSTGSEPTPVPPVQQPPQQPAALPTYTPYPTYTSVPSPTMEPPATVTPTAFVKLPNANRISFDESVSGNTKARSDTWYFTGKQGEKVTITMVGEYPYFYLRDENNESLRGCDETSPSICVVLKFSLPYSGVFYIITDKREVQSGGWWRNDINKLGGPYTLTIQIEP